MSRLGSEIDDQQLPREKETEFDDDGNSSHSKGYISIYRKKMTTFTNRSKICIALVLFAFVISICISIWIYSSKSVEQAIRNKNLDEQIHQIKDSKVQSLEISNQLLKDKLQESNKQNIRLKEQLNKAESTVSPQQSPKETAVAPQNQQPKKDKPVAEEDKFMVPKIIWSYLSRPVSQENYVMQRSFQNKKWYAEKSGFQLRTVEKDNYRLWLSSKQTQQLEALIKDLQSKRGGNQQINSKFQRLRQNLIMLHLLHHFGGVVIGKHYIFTENLDWLQNIKSNILVNIGNPYAKPKVFSFFAISEGLVSTKHNKKAKFQVDKYLIISPAPKDYFIAALAGTEYMADLLSQYIEIVLNPGQIVNIMRKDSVTCGQMNTNDLNGAFQLASHIIVQRKQNQLNKDQAKFEGQYNKFAIDEYGLFTVNQYYFPNKMQYYFTNRLSLFDNFFNYAAKMAQDQFEDSIGPMRYIANPDPHGEFNPRLESARDGKGYTIVEGSFMQRHLFMDKKYDFIKPNLQKRNTAIFKKWENLPKTLWLYWDSGSQNASVTNQLCILSLIKNAKAAGYEVKEVNDANAHTFIPQQTLDKVINGIKNAKIQMMPQHKSDFYRLALLSTYGGIYLDSSYYFLEDFTWITEVSKEPTKYFFNRFGDVPKVLMQFHPTEGGPFDWTVDQTYNTKATWHLAFENNFLAADKDSEFIKNWFQMFIYFVGSQYEETENKMRQCSMVSHKWSNKNNRYLTAMDSLKAVLGCKQNDINNNKDKYANITNAADYYKIWGFNGFTGIQKFRSYNNYANAYNSFYNQDNILMYRYSQQYTELVYGHVYKTIKLYGGNIRLLNNVISSQRQTDFKFECHPDSFFMKYFYNKDEHEFIQTNGLHVKLKT